MARKRFIPANPLDGYIRRLLAVWRGSGQVGSGKKNHGFGNATVDPNDSRLISLGRVTRAALCSFRSVPFIRRPYVPTLCFLDGEVLRVVTCGSDDGGGGDDVAEAATMVRARACVPACRERACTRARVGVRQCQGREMSSICPFLFRALSFSSPIYSLRLPLFLFFFLCVFFVCDLSPPFYLSLSLSVRPFVSRCLGGMVQRVGEPIPFDGQV